MKLTKESVLEAFKASKIILTIYAFLSVVASVVVWMIWEKTPPQQPVDFPTIFARGFQAIVVVFFIIASYFQVRKKAWEEEYDAQADAYSKKLPKVFKYTVHVLGNRRKAILYLIQLFNELEEEEDGLGERSFEEAENRRGGNLNEVKAVREFQARSLYTNAQVRGNNSTEESTEEEAEEGNPKSHKKSMWEKAYPVVAVVALVIISIAAVVGLASTYGPTALKALGSLNNKIVGGLLLDLGTGILLVGFLAAVAAAIFAWRTAPQSLKGPYGGGVLVVLLIATLWVRSMSVAGTPGTRTPVVMAEEVPTSAPESTEEPELEYRPQTLQTELLSPQDYVTNVTSNGAGDELDARAFVVAKSLSKIEADTLTLYSKNQDAIDWAHMLEGDSKGLGYNQALSNLREWRAAYDGKLLEAVKKDAMDQAKKDSYSETSEALVDALEQMVIALDSMIKPADGDPDWNGAMSAYASYKAYASAYNSWATTLGLTIRLSEDLTVEVEGSKIDVIEALKSAYDKGKDKKENMVPANVARPANPIPALQAIVVATATAAPAAQEPSGAGPTPTPIPGPNGCEFPVDFRNQQPLGNYAGGFQSLEDITVLLTSPGGVLHTKPECGGTIVVIPSQNTWVVVTKLWTARQGDLIQAFTTDTGAPEIWKVVKDQSTQQYVKFALVWSATWKDLGICNPDPNVNPGYEATWRGSQWKAVAYAFWGDYDYAIWKPCSNGEFRIDTEPQQFWYLASDQPPVPEGVAFKVSLTDFTVSLVER